MGNRVRHDDDMLDGWVVAGAFELAEQGAPRFFPPFQRLLRVAPREDEPRVVGAPAPPLRLRPKRTGRRLVELVPAVGAGESGVAETKRPFPVEIVDIRGERFLEPVPRPVDFAS